MNIRVFFPPVLGCGMVAVLSLLSSLPLFGAVPGDEHWDAQFGAPGVSNTVNTVYAVAVNNGMVYVAGYSSAGRTNAPLYMWDGKQWTSPALFSGPSILKVYDLIFVGNTLYAAGNFTNVNGVAAYGLAKWDGTTWSGIGFSGVANALATDGNWLYVGGTYTNAGGVAATNIGYWDGSAWHVLGAGLGSAGSGIVSAIAVRNGLVYAGGYFAASGSQPMTNLAVWNGSTWSAVGGGANYQVTALAFKTNDLYVGGYFTLAGSTAAKGIAKWDGTNWTALGSGLTGGSSVALGIAILNGVVTVTGSFTNAGGVSAYCFATWNGSTWSAPGDLNSVGYRAVSAGDGKIYVGGSFTVAGGVWANDIATWDGTAWASLATPGRGNGAQNTVTALASDGTNLYVGGWFLRAGHADATGYIARFDGKDWHSLGPGLNGQVTAIAVTNNLVYAGGYFTATANSQPLHYIGCWDGTNWNSLGGGQGLVYALAVGTDGLYAAGTGYDGTNYGFAFFSRWDGTAWNGALKIDSTNTYFVYAPNSIGYKCIAIQKTNIYLGGNIWIAQFDPSVGDTPITNCYYILRSDRNSSWIMGTGLDNVPVALAVMGTNLFVAGTFTTAGDVPANQIAKWDGQSWMGVGGGVVGSGTIYALATLNNNLYAGGTFTNIGGVSASRIAKWDGTNWSALGSGLPTSGLTAAIICANALAVSGSDVYVGGTFRKTGDKTAYNIGHWNESANFNTPQLVNPAWLTNRQFQARLMGISGLTNIIQATTNFASWTSILTNSTGVYDFIDPNSAAYPRRFYRALLGP